jgi:hypothetical protein
MTFELIISLEQRGRLLEVKPGRCDEQLLEGQIMLTFPAPIRPVVELDDQPVQVTWRSRESIAACIFDLTNEVGFHRLRIRLGVRIYEYDFETSTAKATHDEVLLMAEVCCQHYFAFRRQFCYVAANGDRRKVHLPQIHFAWLRDRLSEIESTIRSINQRPAYYSSSGLRHSRSGKGVSLPATIRLLQERPDLLEEREDGPVNISGKCFWPAMVVKRVSNAEPARQEHFSIARFLEQLLRGCADLRNQVDSALYDDIDRVTEVLIKLLKLPIFYGARGKSSASACNSTTPTHIERTDSRYARMRSLRVEYFSEIGPSNDYKRSIRANIKDISEIYQTFVAHVMGNALGLAYCSDQMDLRERRNDGASMSSGEWLLGFDAKPPRPLLSWREDSARPAGERPDISLVSVDGQRAVLFDAKFRTTRNGRAKQEDLFEMQGYLNSFSITQGGIIFPGAAPSPKFIEAQNHRLVELPVRASFFETLGGKEEMHSYIQGSVERTLRPHELSTNT